MTSRAAIVIVAIAFVVTSCGDDSDSFGSFIDQSSGGSSDRQARSGAAVCGLLSSAELNAVLGEAPQPSESEPAGPFTGCSWGTGDVLVNVAETGSIILAPGEDECPSAQLGDESYACEGRVIFLTGDTHVTVSTIDPFVSDDQLKALAETVFQNIAN